MLESTSPKMNCNELKSAVRDWLGREFECRPSVDDGLIATLPLLKPNGDAIELGLEILDENHWIISDLGDTYATLYLGGVELAEEYARAGEFEQIKLDHRITDDGEQLSIETSGDIVAGMFEFAHAIQSMLALQLTVQPRHPPRDFASIVAKFLGEQHVSFGVPEDLITGKGGRWKFDSS